MTQVRLVFDEHYEEAEEKLMTGTPVLSLRDSIREAPEDPVTHLLIEGENRISLAFLEEKYTEAIDVIYIDPPYNTGNYTFAYEDRYAGSEWLSFMAKRLRIAKKLLTEDGFIAISIDERELAPLKLLCDDIFTGGFINIISVKTKASAGASGGGEDKKFKKNIEYLLIYARDKDRLTLIFPDKRTDLMSIIEEKEKQNKHYEYNRVLLEEGEPVYLATIQDGRGDDIVIFERQGAVIRTVKQLMREKNMSMREVYETYFDRIIRTTNSQSSIRTRVNEAVGKMKTPISITYTPQCGKRKGLSTTKYFINGDLVCRLSDTAEQTPAGIMKKEKCGTLWDDLSWNGIAGEGGVDFKNGKKPIRLIRRIVSMHPNPNAVVLDFFAGSGTTAEAVLEQNREDGGKRKFILCTNNELGTKAKQAAGEAGVCEGTEDYETYGVCRAVTWPRIRNVISGMCADGTKYSDGLPANVDYFVIIHG